MNTIEKMSIDKVIGELSIPELAEHFVHLLKNRERSVIGLEFPLENRIVVTTNITENVEDMYPINPDDVIEHLMYKHENTKLDIYKVLMRLLLKIVKRDDLKYISVVDNSHEVILIAIDAKANRMVGNIAFDVIDSNITIH